MIERRALWVVVPAWNEQDLIGRTLDSIPSVVDHVLVVDDASTDDTVKRVEDRGEKRVELVRRERNGGVGAAIVHGYRVFLERTHPDDDEGAICVVMAGDAQMDPHDLPMLLDPILSKGAGYTKGNRLLTHDVREVMPKTRYVGNMAFSVLTKMASGYWHVMDSQCGYTAITREALARVDLSRVYARYGFPNDFLVRLNVVGVAVADVPVRAIYGEEKSGIKPWKVIPTISMLLLRGFAMRMWRKYVLKDFHPLVLLYFFGFALAFLGLAFGAWIVFLRVVEQSVATPATVILCALFLIVGLQSVFFAMMFDMLVNNDLRVRS